MSAGQQNRSQPTQNQRPTAGQTEPPPDLGDIKEDVSQAAELALERGRQFVDSARAQATGFMDQRKNDAAQSVTDVATALREACKSFDDRQNIRAFVDNAADGLEQLADTIRDRSFAEIYEDIEDTLRRRPAAFAAVSLAAGFLVSRFIKASADNLREAGANRRAMSARGGTGHGAGRASATAGSRSGSSATVRL